MRGKVVSCVFPTLVLGIIAVVHGFAAVADDETTAEPSASRTLVWTQPGTSGNILVADNWTEYGSMDDYRAGRDGRAAARGPDRDTDLVLPASPGGRPYLASHTELPRKRLGGLDEPQWFCRDLIIGEGAGLDAGCGMARGRPSASPSPAYDTPFGVLGDIIVEEGGDLYGPVVMLGDRDARVVLDGNLLWRSLRVQKMAGRAVTLSTDQLVLAGSVHVQSGRLVLDTGCRLRFGAGHQARIEAGKLRGPGELPDDAYLFVHRDAALVMRPGSRVGRAAEPENVVADLRIEGLLQIGSPRYKHEARASESAPEPAVIELSTAEGDVGFLTRPGGLYLRPTSEVRNFGRLTIRGKAESEKGEPGDSGAAVFLEKAVDLGRVHFERVRRGGIAAVDLRIAKDATARATFGDECGGEADELCSTFGRIAFAGGVGTVEFVDGLQTRCKILFPHAGRLIVRGLGNRTLQSFDLASVHAVTIDRRRTEFTPRRPLTPEEQHLRKTNALWADVPGDGQLGRYGDQEWPDCPVMIWARPGVSGARFVGANWLDEHGVPYFEVPLISQRTVRSDNPPVDMLLPAADVPYVAAGRGRCGNEGAPPHRHLTIEAGACYGSTYNVQGNLWMKHGSGLSGWHRGRFANDRPGLHRFLRFDGMRIPYRRGDITAPLVESHSAVLAQWGHFSTGDGGTLELIGHTRAAADRLYIDGTGTLILSEGSQLEDGARAGVWIMPNATLVLLQDARIGSEVTMQHAQCYATVMVSGTLKIGLPEKPITRDMRFPLSGVRSETISRNPSVDMRSAGSSFVLSRQGRLELHSAAPSRARLVFDMHDSARAVAAGERYARDRQPEGIVCYFGGKAELDGLVFDNVHPGGIVVSETTRAGWKNVSYGENNLAEPEELYRKLDEEE